MCEIASNKSDLGEGGQGVLFHFRRGISHSLSSFCLFPLAAMAVYKVITDESYIGRSRDTI